MVVSKKDFDKVLVNLLRKNPNFENIALIDSEGMPISFAVKSRQFQIKPATLGSKTKILLYLSKSFSRSINIMDPIIQVIFFEKVVILIVNLKIVNFFIIFDLKGWPMDGKVLYEAFQEIKLLLTQVEQSKDDSLKALFESEKNIDYKISDINDTFLKIIAKNINSLNQLQIDPIQPQKSSASLNPNELDTYKEYFNQNLMNKKILEALVLNDEDIELFKMENTHSNFKNFKDLLQNTVKEIETFDLGLPVLILSIFEKSEILTLVRFGKIANSSAYCGLLMENRLGNITELIKILYQISLDMKFARSNEELRTLVQILELIGFSVENLNNVSESLIQKDQFELADSMLERAANVLQAQNKFSEAGVYHSKLGNSYKARGNMEKAEKQYQISAALHLKERNYDNAGDANSKLGQLAYVTKDLPKSLEYFKNAEKYYKNAGNESNIKKAKETIKKIEENFQNQLKEYLETTSGESIPFSLLEKKFNLSEELIITIFKGLVERNEIPGQINLIKKRYTKKRMGSDEAIIGDESVSGKIYELPPLNKVELVSKQRKLEADLTNFEDIFEKINLPFEQYIKYQTILSELNFLEQKSKIYTSNLENNTCVICIRRFNKKDEISDCGNGHYYHLKCLQLWLENQKKCPVCDINILENLKVFYLDTIEAKEDLISLQGIVKTLKMKVDNLENEIKKREEQIYLMRDYSEKDKNVFEKLMVERDSKHLMEKELKKNNRIIQELRGLLEIIKK